MSRRSNPAEELLRRTAHRETFRNLAHQLQCLKRRYNVLYGVTTDTSSSSNQVEQVSSQQQQPNSRAFILRKLKYALRTQYEACFPLPPPDLCTVLLLFDTNEEAFFEIRLKPKAWPEDWPTRFDCGSAGIDMELLSGAIYMKVLEALREEGDGMSVEEPPRAFGVVSSSRRIGDRTCTRGLRSSVVEENRLTRVIVKSEEEEIVISDGEEEEEEEENNIPANEQVNRRASADGHQEMEEVDRMNNNMFHGEDLAGRPRREESSSIRSSSTANHYHNHNNNHNSNGSSSSQQRPFSNTASVKQEPTANNSSITRRSPHESTSRSALQNYPPSPPPPPPSAAAAARAPRTSARARGRALAPAAASASTSHLLNNNRARRSPSEMAAVADRFTASSAYQSARTHDHLSCPLCSKPIMKFTLTDHLNAVHLGRRRYHCAWPDGCAKAFGYRRDSQRHLRQVHRSTEYERYLQVRE